MERLRALSGHVDLTAIPFTRLAPLAFQLGWPRDWRVTATPADDVGNRPPLASLGPFRWQPVAAPPWTLLDAKQQTWSLNHFRGKPLVLIFYLGFGCLHCTEQLHELGPYTDEFRTAGFEIVAISSDDLEGLKKSIDDYDGVIPFPLLANPNLEVFQAFRAFDSFENQPLHGTYLIDAEGRIRWFDISYEPFMDAEFLLEEGKRLTLTSQAP